VRWNIIQYLAQLWSYKFTSFSKERKKERKKEKTHTHTKARARTHARTRTHTHHKCTGCHLVESQKEEDSDQRWFLLHYLLYSRNNTVRHETLIDETYMYVCTYRKSEVCAKLHRCVGFQFHGCAFQDGLMEILENRMSLLPPSYAISWVLGRTMHIMKQTLWPKTMTRASSADQDMYFCKISETSPKQRYTTKVLPPKVGLIMLMSRPTTMKYEILNILFGRSNQPPAPPLMPDITR